MRFLSHHEVCGALERGALRAGLPLRHTQGFNPHPILSLPAPRPVGVSGQDELLILSLESPLPPQDVLSALNAQAPPGVRFLSAAPLTGSRVPRPQRADYRLVLTRDQVAPVQAHVEGLKANPTWPVERKVRVAGRRRGEPMGVRMIDIKPMIAGLSLEGDTLRWSVVPQGDAWARPGEVLALLDLPQTHLADVVRTAVCCSGDAGAPHPWERNGSPYGPPDEQTKNGGHPCRNEC